MDGLLRDAVARLAGPGQVVEVRALTDQYTHSGYFSDHDALIRAVEPLDADSSVHGIYVTLNEVNPALLSRRANRIKMRLGKKDSTTSDADILRRRWLPIDIDPLRPSGVSSTDEEHGLALAKADEVARWIAGLGFPDPVRADSGNGAHLLYRIDLPNDEAATALVKSCLATLDTLFSDERVNVDTANFNAARIWKLYGTVSRKGDNTPERPHRRSRILSAPEELSDRDGGTAQGSRGQAPDRAARTAQPATVKGKGFDLCTLAFRSRRRGAVRETVQRRHAFHSRPVPVLVGPQGRGLCDPVRQRCGLCRLQAHLLRRGYSAVAGTPRAVRAGPGDEAEGLGAETKDLAEGPGKGES